jgi:hypothetical protein
MNSLESRSHGHKYFEYEFCTPTWSKTIQSERIYGVWRSDWMVFAVFMGCDVLIRWFSLYLWGVTFSLDGFRCIYEVWLSDFLLDRKPSNQNVTPHKYSENHPIRTSHPINTAKTIQSERYTP